MNFEMPHGLGRHNAGPARGPFLFAISLAKTEGNG